VLNLYILGKKNKQLFVLRASQKLCLAELLLLYSRKVKNKLGQALPNNKIIIKNSQNNGIKSVGFTDK